MPSFVLLVCVCVRACVRACVREYVGQCHNGGGVYRVGGGVHDSYTFQSGLVGSFTSPGIDTR